MRQQPATMMELDFGEDEVGAGVAVGEEATAIGEEGHGGENALGGDEERPATKMAKSHRTWRQRR